MVQFGGTWTEQKIKIIVEYAKAYLTIMKNYPRWKLLYFDGFAGSGEISLENKEETIEGAARRILQIEEPKPFDMYYFVEKKKKNARALEIMIRDEFPEKTDHAYVVTDDCNLKLKDMADFLENQGGNYKVLAFIDPCGMQVNWNSIEELKGLGIDMWILTPIGIGPNRLLKKNGDITKKCMEKLVNFLGISQENIYKYFYIKTGQQSMFVENNHVIKSDKPIQKLGELYTDSLNNIFKYVSKPYILRNKKNNPMYHFFFVSNNKTAVRIANDIIEKWSQ